MIIGIAFLAGLAVGGFGGCAAMAFRHGRELGRIEGDYRANVRILARRVANHAQYDLGTPREAETTALLQVLYRESEHRT